MQAGETIMHKPFVLRYCKDGLMGVTKAVPCEVLWVHPEGRFAVLERDNGLYKYRECIPIVSVRTNEREERGNENDSGNELEGRGGKNRNCPHFGRRAAPRREDFGDR